MDSVWRNLQMAVGSRDDLKHPSQLRTGTAESDTGPRDCGSHRENGGSPPDASLRPILQVGLSRGAVSHLPSYIPGMVPGVSYKCLSKARKQSSLECSEWPFPTGE